MLVRAQMVLHRKTGLSRDAIVNVFHFEASEAFGSLENPDNIRDLVRDFYRAPANTDAGNLVAFMSSSLTDTWTLKLYDAKSPPPNVPLHTYEGDFGTIARQGAANLPGEVAYDFSWRAATEAGVLPARRRGRTFLGPLNLGAIQTTSPDGIVRPGTAFLARARIQAAGLIQAADASISNDFVVYSRMDDVGRKVVECDLDDAMDTIRSRGVAPTTKIVAPPAA